MEKQPEGSFKLSSEEISARERMVQVEMAVKHGQWQAQVKDMPVVDFFLECVSAVYLYNKKMGYLKEEAERRGVTISLKNFFQDHNLQPIDICD